MPAQPLSSLTRDIRHFDVDPEVLERVPSFSPYIARVIAEWAHIDGDFATMLGGFLQADFAVATAMLQALNGSGAKRAALAAAAKEALPPDDYALFEVVTKLIRPSRDTRNAFAHHVWGYLKTFPDCLLLMEASVIVSIQTAWDSGKKSATEIIDGVTHYTIKFPAGSQPAQTKVFVYTENTMKEAVSDAIHARSLVVALWNTVRNNLDSAEARTWLLNQRPVQQALAALSRKNTQATPSAPTAQNVHRLGL